MADVPGCSAAVAGPIPVFANAPLPEPAGMPLLTLEVTRGQTMFPFRPVAGTRFLIGSGEGCHLRLGGPDLPTLHSLIAIDGNDVTLESISVDPPLRVNGRIVVSTPLAHGDRIEIGPFQLTARLIPPHADPAPEAQVPNADSITDDRAPEELTAPELVAHLEREWRLVEKFDLQRELGATALLERVQQWVDESTSGGRGQEVELPADRVVRVDERAAMGRPHISTRVEADGATETNARARRELERLQAELQQVSRKLDARADQLSLQEATVAEAATELMETQQRLEEQLERLLAQAKSQSSLFEPSSATVRASA